MGKMQMPSPDDIGENIMAKIMGKIAEKPGKKAKQVKEPSPEPEPEPETPQKLTRSDVKKIIIPKKSTLKKRALIEAKRKARIIEAGGDPEVEVETEDYRIRNQIVYSRKKMAIILNLTRVIFSVKEEEVRDTLIRNYIKLVLAEQQHQTLPWQWLHLRADRIDLQRP